MVKREWLATLADDIAALHKDGADILVVSSGAIALGRSVLGLAKGPLKLEDSQAAAAVGQIALARTWSEALGDRGITAGQILVTFADTEERRRYLNARATIERLLDLRPCRSSTRTTRSRPPRSAMATTIGSRRASRPWPPPIF